MLLGNTLEWHFNSHHQALKMALIVVRRPSHLKELVNLRRWRCKPKTKAFHSKLLSKIVVLLLGRHSELANILNKLLRIIPRNSCKGRIQTVHNYLNRHHASVNLHKWLCKDKVSVHRVPASVAQCKTLSGSMQVWLARAVLSKMFLKTIYKESNVNTHKCSSKSKRRVHVPLF